MALIPRIRALVSLKFQPTRANCFAKNGTSKRPTSHHTLDHPADLILIDELAKLPTVKSDEFEFTPPGFLKFCRRYLQSEDQRFSVFAGNHILLGQISTRFSMHQIRLMNQLMSAHVTLSTGSALKQDTMAIQK